MLFTRERGITPPAVAHAAETAGSDPFYGPEHTHIPVKCTAAHPRTGDSCLPDDRYLSTLDPWVSRARAAAVTTHIRLATTVVPPGESDPITLAKAIATVDHLSGGRVTLGVGFGWNTDELADHGVPARKRRTVLREYLTAMRALWTEDVASDEGGHVAFGPSWAWPKPVQLRIPAVPTAGSPHRPKWTAGKTWHCCERACARRVARVHPRWPRSARVRSPKAWRAWKPPRHGGDLRAAGPRTGRSRRVARAPVGRTRARDPRPALSSSWPILGGLAPAARTRSTCDGAWSDA